ncbi:sialidase family protein [Guyparkeria sp.]|uniref:sialidase family protein n=1 Tax=Guyparkeria sp. TaxID=2035736 RepID=UPI003970B391
MPARLAVPLAVAGALALMTGCDSDGRDAGAANETAYQQTAYRVRADNAAGLNSDVGWAGATDKDVTINADSPFRLRFEVESSSGIPLDQPLHLESRRNDGAWERVAGEDFPQSTKVLGFDFDDRHVRVHDYEGRERAIPSDVWRLERGDQRGLTIDSDGESYLRATGGEEGLLALGQQETLWEPMEFATEMRLGEGATAGAGLIFGYEDADNYYLAQIDPAGSVSVSRFVDGERTRLTDSEVPFDLEPWFELKVGTEGGELVIEVEREHQGVVLPVDADVALDAAAVGFHVPPDGEAWFRHFAVEGEPSSPRVSVMASGGYRHGEATTDRLAGSDAPFVGGAGVSFADRTPPVSLEPGQSEWEWPLVLRRFADGAVTNRTGDVFAFRMVTQDGQPVAGDHPEVTLVVPDGHLGGTFVETPGRIGPWQADNGDLYFLMEPAETFNVLMTVKSTDAGRSWQEVDGAHRPTTGDLEGFATTRVGDTIHMVHQTSDDVWYHAFLTSDHPDRPDTWSVQDEWVAAPAEPPTQVADIAVRSDGSIVVVYGGPEKIHYTTRSPAGDWGEETVIDAEAEHGLSGPMLVRGADDVIHLAYTANDGTAWYRRLSADGELTSREQLATGLGTDAEDVGSILPLVHLPESNTVSVIYRLDDGTLQERRSIDHGPLSDGVTVTDRAVVQNAVDADQTGADAIVEGESVHVLFIDEATRQLYYTRRDPGGAWSSPVRQTEGVNAQWVRGSRLIHDGRAVYGYVVDAGSDGGSGRNRYAAIALDN